MPASLGDGGCTAASSHGRKKLAISPSPTLSPWEPAYCCLFYVDRDNDELSPAAAGREELPLPSVASPGSCQPPSCPQQSKSATSTRSASSRSRANSPNSALPVSPSTLNGRTRAASARSTPASTISARSSPSVRGHCSQSARALSPNHGHRPNSSRAVHSARGPSPNHGHRSNSSAVPSLGGSMHDGQTPMRRSAYAPRSYGSDPLPSMGVRSPPSSSRASTARGSAQQPARDQLSSSSRASSNGGSPPSSSRASSAFDCSAQSVTPISSAEPYQSLSQPLMIPASELLRTSLTRDERQRKGAVRLTRGRSSAHGRFQSPQSPVPALAADLAAEMIELYPMNSEGCLDFMLHQRSLFYAIDRTVSSESIATVAPHAASNGGSDPHSATSDQRCCMLLPEWHALYATNVAVLPQACKPAARAAGMLTPRVSPPVGRQHFQECSQEHPTSARMALAVDRHTTTPRLAHSAPSSARPRVVL